MLPGALNPADILRLLPLPIFLWISWQDIQTRRVPHRVWPPLIIYGLLLIPIDIHHVWTTAGVAALPHALQTLLTITITIPLAILLWRAGGWGGADTKALITIAILFPTYPTYLLPTDTLPLHVAPHTIFPLTILTNSVLLLAAIIILRGGLTIFQTGTITAHALIGKPIRTATIPDRHGKMLEDTNGKRLDGVDLDSIKNYLNWADHSIDDLPELEADPEHDWNTEAFVKEHDNVYTPTPAALDDALTHIARSDTVWISPGLPFLVYFTAGLVVALTIGSLLTLGLPLPPA